jgi:hypothetical protein
MMPAGRAGSSMRSVMAEPVSAARLPPVPASATGAAAPPLSRRRSIAVWALIVVASVISLISILTIWVDRQMLDNNSWRRATEQVVNDPEVRHALATRLVNTVYANTDVAGSLEQRLPENLTGLAVPLADGLHGPAISGAEELLSRPRFRQLVINASVAAHDKLVNVLENTTGHGISTGNGVVTLDVKELLRQIAHDLGLPGKAVEKLPDDAGVITLMRSDQLTAAQNGVRLVNALSAWLLVAVLVLYGLAIYLAHGARRRTLARVAWGVITVGLLVLLVRRALGNYIVDALASGADRTPVRHLWLVGTSILGETGRAAVLYGLIAVLGATLAGGSSVAVRLRRHIAPVVAARPTIMWGSAAFTFLLLVLWGGTHALRTWWGILLLGGLLALGIAALERQFEAEAAVEQASDSGANGSSPPEHPSTAEEIDRLVELRRSGAITNDEFERAKTIALA